MTLISEQVLELRGMPWLHEERNVRGEWTHGGGGLAVHPRSEESRGYRGRFEGYDPLRPSMAPADQRKPLDQPGRIDGLGTPGDPIDVHGDMGRAVQLMADGKHVRLNSPREIKPLLDEVNRQVTAQGYSRDHEPTWDLGNISVTGTRLFNEQTLGIARQDMPQLNGPAEPGTEAALLAGGANKFIELDPEFRAQLKRDGIDVKNERVPAGNLRATQTQLTAATVAGITQAAASGNAKVRHMLSEPIWVTSDNYVLDGHHRWASDEALAFAGLGPKDIEVQRIGLPARLAVPYALAFAQQMGIGGRAIGNAKLVESTNISAQVLELRFDPLERRDPHGRWTRGGDVIDLFHHTTPENASLIRQTGKFTSPERDEYGRPVAFFTTDPGAGAQAGGRGSGLVHIRVPRNLARLEDEFPSGEQHYSIPTSQIRQEHIVPATEASFGKLLRKVATPFVGPAPEKEAYPGQFSDRIIKFWKSEDNPDAKQALNRAGANWDAGAGAAAARELRNAARLTPNANRATEYNQLATNIETAGHTNAELRQAVAAEADKAKTIVPELVSHGSGSSEIYSGKISIYPVAEKPDILAELDWNGNLSVQDDVAAALKAARDHPDQPVKYPDAFEIIEHEMIHGVVPTGSEADNQRAYQDFATAQIEEGFTELGAIHHAPEFMDQMGISGRESGVWQGHTVGDMAAQMRDPAEIANGNSWGHYPQQTKDAQDWVQLIAQEEGHSDLRPDHEGYARVMELTDQVNQQGSAGKIRTMARQLVQTMVSTHPAISGDIGFAQDLEGKIEQQIRAQWNPRSDVGAARQAFTGAKALAIQRVAEREREMAERAA